MAIDIKNLNSISSSKYDIYTKLLDLAADSEYVTDQNNFENVDFLKSGLFGYVTESLAMIMRDSSFHKTMIYKENFLNTAILPKSIYNWAKMFNVNCIDAIPSSRNGIFTINVKDIDSGINNISNNIEEYREKYGIVEEGNFIVLDKENPIIAGDYYFSLEHSIEIYKNKKNSYVIKYCVNEQNVTTSFGDYTNTIIPYQYKTENGETYITFKARIFQYKIVETSKIISSSSFLDIRTHTFTYTGQLCGLSLEYTKNNETTNVDLKFSNITMQSDTESTVMSAYYSLDDENTVEIVFNSNKTGGLPQAGGTLTLKTFITEGSSGNISFDGDAIFLISQEDFKVISVAVKLDSIILTSGLDQSSLQQIKNTIINKFSLRNTIITENDLNIWFENQSKLLENVNNSLITFRKEKDNLLKRTFAAYLLLRDGVELSTYLDSTNTTGSSYKASSSYLSSVIPTNTVDVTYTTLSSAPVNSEFYLNPNGIISYDSTTKKYYYNEDTETTTTSFKYVTPFHIYVDTEHNLVSYLYTDTEYTSAINYNSLNGVRDLTNISLTPLYVEVTHDNSNKDDSNYHFKFYFNSDIDLSATSLSQCSLQINNFSTINFSITDNQIYFTKVESDDSDSSTTDDSSENANYVLELTASVNSNTPFNLESENPYINLNFGDESATEALSIPEQVYLYLSIAGKSNDNLSSFDITVSSDNELTLFYSLGDIMSSDLLVNKDADGNVTGYVIKEVPVIASYWYNSDVNKEWFIKQLFVFISMLKENSGRLETTTFFNIKFRNTYGISNYFNSLYSNIRLKLTIYLKNDAINSYTGSIVNAGSVAEALENEIRDYIRILVDQSNNDGAIVISKIIMKVQAAYYNYIDHIDFNGLNGTFNQYIKSIDTTEFYPLEYINLDDTFTKIGSNSDSMLKQDIVFETV